jgi:hypothetical protein
MLLYREAMQTLQQDMKMRADISFYHRHHNYKLSTNPSDKKYLNNFNA